MKIIVTGSLGNISKPLTEKLIKNGHQVTVISSNAEKQNAITALGAIPATGLLTDVDFLTDIFRGADVAYCMIPPDFAAPDPLVHYQTIGQSYAEAIQRSGVTRVICLSSWGAHLEKGTGFITGSYLVEQLLNKVPGAAITYLRPASFYYNLFHYISMIKEAGFIGTNYGGEDKLVMVSPTDIASAAVEEIESTSINKIRYVASDERRCNEIAAVLGIAIGKPDLKWVTFTNEQVQSALEKTGMPVHIAEKMVELNASIHSGLLREDYDRHAPVKGKIKLEDFANEFAIAFNK